MVAKLISPEALLDLLHNGRLSDVFPGNVPPIEGLSSEALGNVWRVYANSELGIARFFVAVPIDKPPVESFRLGFCLLEVETLQCRTSGSITNPLGEGNIEDRTTVTVQQRTSPHPSPPICYVT